MTAKQKLAVLALIVCGAAAGVVARQPVWNALHGRPNSVSQPARPAPLTKPPPSAREIARPHLMWAADECESAIEEHLQSLEVFFSDAKQNTRAFADEALSWSSKWRLVADYVPYTKGGRHEQFIRAKFEDRIFTTAQVEQAVRQAVETYLQEVKSIEGTMLVRIKADVADFPLEYPIAALDNDGWRQRYEAAIEQAIEATKNDAARGASLEVVSLIVGEVLTQVAVELGVSAGILGTGAALSWQTLGLGVVVGVIVDAIVSWVWDWWADPKGELAAKLDLKIDDMHRLTIEGSQTVTGLRVRLRQLARERARLRGTAVVGVLKLQHSIQHIQTE
jgi:hypothetical protein